MAELHPIERAQIDLQAEIPEEATVHEAIAAYLGLDAGDELEELIARQVMEADRHVEVFVPTFHNVRRAGVAAGFIAGVSFTVAALRAGPAAAEHARLQAEAAARGWPVCPEHGVHAIEANVAVRYESGMGAAVAKPDPAGPSYRCPEGHWFAP